jgi:hypothetical protein
VPSPKNEGPIAPGLDARGPPVGSHHNPWLPAAVRSQGLWCAVPEWPLVSLRPSAPTAASDTAPGQGCWDPRPKRLGRSLELFHNQDQQFLTFSTLQPLLPPLPLHLPFSHPTPCCPLELFSHLLTAAFATISSSCRQLSPVN